MVTMKLFVFTQVKEHKHIDSTFKLRLLKRSEVINNKRMKTKIRESIDNVKTIVNVFLMLINCTRFDY